MNKDQVIDTLQYWINDTECNCGYSYSGSGCIVHDLERILEYVRAERNCDYWINDHMLRFSKVDKDVSTPCRGWYIVHANIFYLCKSGKWTKGIENDGWFETEREAFDFIKSLENERK